MDRSGISSQDQLAEKNLDGYDEIDNNLIVMGLSLHVRGVLQVWSDFRLAEFPPVGRHEY